jgi:hypothetical protein
MIFYLLLLTVVLLDLYLPYLRLPVKLPALTRDKASVHGVTFFGNKIFVVRSNSEKVTVFTPRWPYCQTQTEEIVVTGNSLLCNMN